MVRDELNDFAFLSGWPMQLERLTTLAQKEPWDFLDLPNVPGLKKHYILNRYLRAIFYKQVVAYNTEPDDWQKNAYVVMRKNIAVMDTGLVTNQHKAIYMLFQPTDARPGILQDWTFKGFVEDTDKRLLSLDVLPDRPHFAVPAGGQVYLPEWPIRMQFDRLLTGESLARLPDWLKEKKVLPTYIESCIEMSRQDAEQCPQWAVHQWVGGQVQFALPLYIGRDDQPDFAVTMSIHEDCYMAHTLVTLQMAYLSARTVGRPTVSWMTQLVE